MQTLVSAMLAVSGIAFAASPVVFEENRGQAAPDVRYLAQCGSYRAFLLRGSVVFASSEGRQTRITLEGARSRRSAGELRSSAVSNYFIGADPAGWRTGVATYGQVRDERVYPGIDMVWHARDGALEQDFQLAPGADPRRIRLRFDSPPALSGDGSLLVGGIRLHPPLAYQDGRQIACSYRVSGSQVRFALGRYNRAGPLVIDPILDFSTFFGIAASASAVRLDAAGNIYVAGTTTSANFPITLGAFQTKYAPGICDAPPGAPCTTIFVSKFSGDGNKLIFSTYLGGGNGNGTLSGMAVDSAGNVYLTGIPDALFPNLTPIGGGPFTSPGSYVAKLSPDGASLLYSSGLPCTTNALAVDAAGSVYLTGNVGGSWDGPLPVTNAFEAAPPNPLIFKTADTGATWQEFADGLAGGGPTFLTVDPTNPQTMYLGLNYALYKSTDGGAHWTEIPNPLNGNPNPNVLVVDPSQPQTLYLGTSAGIYKSTDGGTTWALAGNGAAKFIGSIAIDPSNTNTLYATSSGAVDAQFYKSTDGGASWTGTTLATLPYFAGPVIVSPSTPSTVYVGTFSGVLKSTDAGSTWAYVNNGLTAATSILALAIDPVNPQTLYASTTVNFAPYKSTDGGAHWTQGAFPGFPPDPTNSLIAVRSLAVDPANDSTVWAGTDQGVLVSHDAGATWGPPGTSLPESPIIAMATDPAGSLYALGQGNPVDAFALKLDATGEAIVYATYLGGSGSDLGYGIAVDTAGRAYVTGRTDSFDFPAKNALQDRLAGRSDVFLAVLSADGTQLEWSTFWGGTGEDGALAIAVDPAGNAHVAGSTASPDLALVNPTQSQLSALSGVGNAFALVLKADGSSALLSTYLGGSSYDVPYAVATNAAGDTYVAGQTSSLDFPTLNAIQSTLAGPSDAFVTAWSGATGAIIYSTFFGGSGNDAALSLALDSSAGAYLTGSTTSSDLPGKYAWQPGFGSCSPNPDGGCAEMDAFLAKISTTGSGPHDTIGAVDNAANYTQTVAPGEVVSIFGTALALNIASASGFPLPQRLADAEVSVNGVAAPLYYVSPIQINAQIPFETAPGTATVQVSSTGGTVNLSVEVTAAAPGIFSLDSSGKGPGAIENAVTGQLVTDANPVTAGDYIAIYCTGLGAVKFPATDGAIPPTPPPQTVATVQVYIANTLAKVTYAGLAPGFAGLYQVNAQVPAGTHAGKQFVQIIAAGATSNPVLVSVK